MILPRIDWAELSLQVVITFGHFLWQACFVALLLAAIDLVCSRAPAFRLRANRGQLPDGLRRSANFAYVVACLAFFALPCCVVSTYSWVHQTRGTILVALTDSASMPVAGESAHDEAAEPAESAATISSSLPPALPELNASEVPAADAPAQQRVERDFLSIVTQRIRVLSFYLCVAYLVGVAWMLGRFSLSLVGGARLQRTLEPISDANVLAMISTQTAKLGLRRIPLVAMCQRIPVPAVVGVLHPTILLPPALLCGLDAQQLAAILSHELAHIRRYDLIVNLLHRFVEALLFFHPATWWISRRVRIERENCCDDFAANSAGRLQYAGALLQMAKLCIGRDRERLSALATLSADGGNASDFAVRVRRLIDAERVSPLSISRRGLVVTGAMASLVLLSMLVWGQSQSPQNRSKSELVIDDDQRGTVIDLSRMMVETKNSPVSEPAHGDDHDHHAIENPVNWIPARPLKTTVSSGSARILDDDSIRLEGDAPWQEATAHFAFDKPTTVDELRLELLPVDSPLGPQFGRGGEKLILFDVKARVEEQTGESKVQEFSRCVSLLNPDDDTTINCIDCQSDTGWTVPALPAGADVHTLVLKFDEPVTLQPGQRFVLSVDSGGSKEFALLNRIRFAFHQAATQTGTVVLHAIDADTGEPISDVAFVKENAVGEYWATPVGRSDADGTVCIETKPLPGYFFIILPVPQGYKVTSLDEVPAQVQVGGRVDYRFHLRKLGTSLEFVKKVPEPNSAANRFARALKDTNQNRFRIVVNDMPGFSEVSVAFSFARDKAPLAERIFANGELVRAAVNDELRYFKKAEGSLAGKISELYDIQVVISSTTLPRAPATSWYLYFRTRDGIALKQDGFRIRFEDLDHWDLEIPAFLHPEF